MKTRTKPKTLFQIILALGTSALITDAFSAQIDSRSNPPPFRIQQAVVADYLDVLTLNVAHARGKALNQLLVSAAKHRKNLREIGALVRQSGSDIIALQEADSRSLWSGRFDHMQYLSGVTGHGLAVQGHHADSWLFTYGTALLSRYEMNDTHSHSFQPSWPTAGKGYVQGIIQWHTDGGKGLPRPVMLVSVHLDFSRKGVRDAQVDELIKNLGDINIPLVIMGDFNADWAGVESPVRRMASTMGLRAFEPFSEGLDSYKDSARLDWILISSELKFLSYSVLPDTVSDHLAVQARIAWRDEQVID